MLSYSKICPTSISGCGMQWIEAENFRNNFVPSKLRSIRAETLRNRESHMRTIGSGTLYPIIESKIRKSLKKFVHAIPFDQLRTVIHGYPLPKNFFINIASRPLLEFLLQTLSIACARKFSPTRWRVAKRNYPENRLKIDWLPRRGVVIDFAYIIPSSAYIFEMFRITVFLLSRSV